MTRDYFTPIALYGGKTIIPTFIWEMWDDSIRAVDDWESIWCGSAEGIGPVLHFAEIMLPWFLEMDRNGLTVLDLDKYSSTLERKAKRGQTSGINLQGAKGREILGIMNQQALFYFISRFHLDTPNNKKCDAYTLALMDACETPYTRRKTK